MEEKNELEQQVEEAEVPEKNEQEQQVEETEVCEKKTKYVNPFLAWGLIAGVLVIAAVVAFVVLR